MTCLSPAVLAHPDFSLMAKSARLEILPSPSRNQNMYPEERAFAAWLDRAGIDYEYEPTLFRLGRKENGKRVSIQPDFYLPQLDMYVELGGFSSHRTQIALLMARLPQVNVMISNQARINDLLAVTGREGDVSFIEACCLLREQQEQFEAKMRIHLVRRAGQMATHRCAA
jgi:hypothetical protein